MPNKNKHLSRRLHCETLKGQVAYGVCWTEDHKAFEREAFICMCHNVSFAGPFSWFKHLKRAKLCPTMKMVSVMVAEYASQGWRNTRIDLQPWPNAASVGSATLDLDEEYDQHAELLVQSELPVVFVGGKPAEAAVKKAIQKLFPRHYTDAQWEDKDFSCTGGYVTAGGVLLSATQKTEWPLISATPRVGRAMLSSSSTHRFPSMIKY
jgi:acyl-CoA synthetase (AMP-forming)/AMP-acid ligase II